MGTPDNEITSGPWFVENAFEELDAPAEYWFDAVNSKLYLYHNDTNGTPPPAGLALWVPQLELLFNLSGPTESTTTVAMLCWLRSSSSSLLESRLS